MLSPRHARANSAFFALLAAYLGALLILSPHSTAQASAKYVSDSDEGALGSLLKTAQEVARQLPTQLIKFLVDVNAKLVHTTDNLLQILRDLLPFGKALDNSNSDTPNKASFENVPKIENDAEMDIALAKSQKIFVMAHAEWCGHCKNMHSDYAKLHSKISTDFINYPPEKIAVYTYNGAKQCKGSAAPCTIRRISEVIQGFPTLLLISKSSEGKPIIEKYEGQRSADAIAEFIVDSFKPLLTSTSPTHVETFLKSTKRYAAIHYLPNLETEPESVSHFTASLQKSNVIYVSHIEHLEGTIPDSALKSLKASPKHTVFGFNDKKFMATLNIDGEFAPISAQINMLVRDGFGRFSDQAFMSSDLGGSLVLLRGASNKVSAEKLNFIKSAMVQSSVLGHASVVLLDSSSKDESRVISMLNIPEDDSDCMCIFDRRSNQKHSVCVDDLTNWKSEAEFAAYILAVTQGNAPDCTEPACRKRSSVSPIVLQSSALAKEITGVPQGFVYVYSVVKQGRENFERLGKFAATKSDVLFFAVDLTMEHEMANAELKISANDKDALFFISNGQIDPNQNPLTGEMSAKKIEDFVSSKMTKQTQAEKAPVVTETDSSVENPSAPEIDSNADIPSAAKTATAADVPSAQETAPSADL